MQRWWRVSPRPTCCASRSTPGGRIRSGCTWRTSATPWWATPRTRAAAAGASRRRSGGRRSSSKRWRRASCCTPPGSPSTTRSPARGSICARNGPPTSCPHWRAPPPMRLCLLNATRCSILASSHRMSDAGVVRLLLFRVGTLVCAADAERVREILPRLETTRIPGAPPPVAGLVNVRGTLITVVEGWRALRQPEPPASNGTHHGTTVLLEVGGGRKGLGLTGDEVVDREAQDLPPPADLEQHGRAVVGFGGGGRKRTR